MTLRINDRSHQFLAKDHLVNSMTYQASHKRRVVPDGKILLKCSANTGPNKLLGSIQLLRWLSIESEKPFQGLTSKNSSSARADKALPQHPAYPSASKITTWRCRSVSSVVLTTRWKRKNKSLLNAHSGLKWSLGKASVQASTATETLKIPIGMCSKIGRPAKIGVLSDGASMRTAKTHSSLSQMWRKTLIEICTSPIWRLPLMERAWLSCWRSLRIVSTWNS